MVAVAEAEADALRREVADVRGELTVERTAAAAKGATIGTLAAHVAECEAKIASAHAAAHAEAERLEQRVCALSGELERVRGLSRPGRVVLCSAVAECTR